MNGYIVDKNATAPKTLDICLADESLRFISVIQLSLVHERKGTGCSVGTNSVGDFVGCGVSSISQSLHSGQYPVYIGAGRAGHNIYIAK